MKMTIRLYFTFDTMSVIPNRNKRKQWQTFWIHKGKTHTQDMMTCELVDVVRQAQVKGPIHLSFRIHFATTISLLICTSE